MYVVAMRTASIATSKQSTAVAAAITASGASAFRPCTAWNRSDCSALVGIPVDGPARCESITTIGSSVAIASPSISVLSAMPGPELDVTPSECLRPAHRAIASRLDGRAAHRVADEMLRHFGRFTERVTGVHGRDIGLGDLGPVGELAAQPLDRRLAVAAVHPQHQAERPHVAAAVRLPARKTERLNRFGREPRDVERQHLVGSERAVLERVSGEARLGEVARGK